MIVSPSLLAADFARLGEQCEMVNDSNADWFHVDVMDGVFVPNISFGSPVIKSIKKVARKPLDVHLMIVDPQRYISMFRDLGADILNVHYEACTHLHRTIQQIRDAGMRPAVTLNPHTPVSVLEEILPDVDMVLLMSVNPGFGGQKFIHNTYDKIRRLRKMIDERHLNTIIEIDGGVDNNTAPLAAQAGATAMVAGSYVFGDKDPKARIAELKSLKQ
ncbi:MAG: ribulose-phosphate 3-epimerase [Bacteroidales bacterium]|jgi:ribulose-phosphate 3-epimerase|nr:ribulose-phosphate 3-epimerase [Bacteroidales bacterium]